MSYHGLGTISPAMRWGATTGTAVNTANQQNTSLIPTSDAGATTAPQTLTTATATRTNTSLIPAGSSLSTSGQRTTLPDSTASVTRSLDTIEAAPASTHERDLSMIPLQTAAMTVSTSTAPSFDERALAIASREAAAAQRANIAAGLKTTLAIPATTNTYRTMPSGGGGGGGAATQPAQDTAGSGSNLRLRDNVGPIQLPSDEEPFYKNPVVIGGGILLLLVAAYAINKSRG